MNEATTSTPAWIVFMFQVYRICVHMEYISGQKSQGKYFIGLLRASCVRSILGLIGSGRVVHKRSELSMEKTCSCEHKNLYFYCKSCENPYQVHVLQVTCAESERVMK